MIFYGPLEKCPICSGQLECKGWKYKCKGKYSEWASCIFSTNKPPRRSGPIKVPDDISDDFVNKVMRSHFGIL
jgi:poly [ADP-ribose] polymerase